MNSACSFLAIKLPAIARRLVYCSRRKDNEIKNLAAVLRSPERRVGVGPIVNNGPIVDTQAAENSSKICLCGICLENKESRLMFANDTCDHSFCYECTCSYIVAKIRDKVKNISCPAPSCSVVLDIEACSLMIPGDALVEWNELLCTALIPESQKIYCPFHDCSALLVNDSCEEKHMGRVTCVMCRRGFCVRCRVPWHEDFTCNEFEKLYGKKGRKADKIVKELARKKRWQKCPKCKIYVEKTEGCMHVTCRCYHQFCYRCGFNWSNNHTRICWILSKLCF